MKQTTTVCIIMLLLVSVFPLTADDRGKRSAVLSFQGMVVENRIVGLGAVAEFFLSDKMSFNLEVMNPGFGSFFLASLDMAWNIKIPSKGTSELMFGLGVTTPVHRIRPFLPNAFLGFRIYPTPKLGIFLKAQGYLSYGGAGTVLVVGVSQNL